jgi:hypothetical protein
MGKIAKEDVTKEIDMTATCEIELIRNHVYRAKKPVRTWQGYFNDRQILWIGATEVQYDSPTVANGRQYPKISKEKFLKWVGEDVTDQMPKGMWMDWIPAKDRNNQQ